MAEYTVMMLREMSQSITVEADSIDEAARLAYDRNDLSPNVTNKFEESGDIEFYNVTDANGTEVWNVDTGRELEL